MISQEARKAVPLKWTFRFRFAKPTEKRVQEIDLNSTFFKNVSGCWSAWNDRVLISPLFSRWFYKNEPKLTHSFGRSSQLKVKTVAKIIKFWWPKIEQMVIILVILDFPQGLRTSLFCIDFRKSLRKFFQLFSLFFLEGLRGFSRGQIYVFSCFEWLL